MYKLDSSFGNTILSQATLDSEHLIRAYISFLYGVVVMGGENCKAAHYAVGALFHQMEHNVLLEDAIDKTAYNCYWEKGDYSLTYPIMVEMLVDILTSEGNEIELSNFIELLVDTIEEIAPDGFYFGSHEGDGLCFGFWGTQGEQEVIDENFTPLVKQNVNLNLDVMSKKMKKKEKKKLARAKDLALKELPRCPNCDTWLMPLEIQDEICYTCSTSFQNDAIVNVQKDEVINKVLVNYLTLEIGTMVLMEVGGVGYFASDEMGDQYVRETLLNYRDTKSPGGFISDFITMYCKADAGNEKLLKPTAIALIRKYKLQ